MLLLGGCVSETTGGFNVEASDEKAVAAYVQLALAQVNEGDLQSARRSIDNARRIDSRFPAIYDAMAMVLQQEGELALAEHNFQRAIDLDSGFSRARNNYAALLFGQGRYEPAREQLLRVTRDIDYPGRAVAFENLGRVYLRLKHTNQAEKAFTRALQLNPGLYNSALELALLDVRREQWESAWRFMQQYLDFAQRNGVPHAPKALLSGIQIGQEIGNQAIVKEFTLLLTTIYQQSPEYSSYLSLKDVN